MRIQHRNGEYEVRFESLEECFQALPSDVRIVTDENVANAVDSLVRFCHVYVIPPGETSKSLEVFGQILSWLASTRASRKTMICAVGGGVVGDLVGFAASAYMRGVPFYQIPTTLLSQVDSSVGGKVGIDLAEGKNLAGAFYPPCGVTIDVNLLNRLPERQFMNGMAEVWKYGFIMDAALVDLLSADRLHTAHPNLLSVVGRCIALKAEVVQQDEYETLGLRAILNFGHTVGHALEHFSGYGKMLHGEAISVGMVVEARLGERLGLTKEGTADQIQKLLVCQGLPVTDVGLRSEDALIAAMYGDKKSLDGKLSFSLLTEIGHCKLIEGVSEESIRMALRES